MKSKAVFLDKDGTLVRDVPFNADPAKIELCEGVPHALRALKKAGYKLVVISNQSGVAHGYFPEESLASVNNRLRELLLPHGAELDSFYYCPHHPGGTMEKYAIECECRKPMPGLLFKAARDLDIDLFSSWMIGDILNDAEAGNRAGCRTVMIDNGNETEWILSDLRTPTLIVRGITRAAEEILRQNKKLKG